MAEVLGYDFDKTYIKKSTYAPRVHSEIEVQQEALGHGAIGLLEGKRCLPMFVTNLPESNQSESDER